MRSEKSLLWLLGILALSMVVGCGDDDGGTTGPPAEVQEPDLSITQVTVPQGLQGSQDPMAQLAMTYVQLANAFSGMMFTPPKDKGSLGPVSAQDGPPWVHTWTEGSLTITMTVDESGTFYTWDVVLDGTDGYYTYSNWLAMEASQTKDGKSGTASFYEPVTTNVLLEWSWSTNPQGVYTFEMTSQDMRIVLMVNPDGSGTLDVYEDIVKAWVLLFKVSWDADGNGQWWEYDEAGAQTGSGSWTADGGEPTEPPDLTATPVSVPQHMQESDNPYAQMATAFVEMANGFSSFAGAYFEPPDGKGPTDGPPWEYTWTDGSLTITLTVDETATAYTWQVHMDGTDGTYTYSNWLAMEAEQSLDGASGTMTVYEPVTTNVTFTWSWDTLVDGTYVFTMISYGYGRIDIVVNPDGSGNLEFYEYAGGTYDDLMLEIVWYADGTGQYTDYASEPPQSGSWTK